MPIEALGQFIGDWELSSDIPGTEDQRGTVVFEWLSDGPILVQRFDAPSPVPNGICLIAAKPDGSGYLQHYFDSRGVVRLYEMTFVDGLWTLARTTPDFSPLDFQQRFTGSFSADGERIDGAWETSDDGVTWRRDFGMSYRRRHQPPG